MLQQEKWMWYILVIYLHLDNFADICCSCSWQWSFICSHRTRWTVGISEWSGVWSRLLLYSPPLPTTSTSLAAACCCDHHAATRTRQLAALGEKMASNDFLENAISSKIDEKSLNDLTNSLESSLNQPQSVSSAVSVDGKSLGFLLFVKRPWISFPLYIE